MDLNAEALRGARVTVGKRRSVTLPGPRSDTYEGGFNLTGKYDGSIQGHVQVASRCGDIDLVVSATAGRASATAVAGLSVEESRELRLALERAERAAENYERNRD